VLPLFSTGVRFIAATDRVTQFMLKLSMFSNNLLLFFFICRQPTGLPKFLNTDLAQ
jgi:hypothetical protein